MYLLLVDYSSRETFTFAIKCSMDTADPPVKVLLTDRIYERLLCAMEEVFLLHSLPSILLLHLLLLPKHKHTQNCQKKNEDQRIF